MKKILLSCFLIAGFTASAQVTGSKTIGIDYATLDAAFADLNAAGVGAGGATINLPAGYTETAPAGGFMLGSAVLNSSLSSTNQLFLQKSGAGANPLITAQVGTVAISAANLIGDAIFNFSGVDHMTIDGIDLQESAANLTTIELVERGFAFYNLNVADGANFNTVKNSTISFLKTSNNYATGIYFAHYLTSAPATAVTPTTADGTHSNNKIYSNTISKGVLQAISFNGFAAVAPYDLYDQNNDIGGSSATTANIISDFGGLVNGGFYITNTAILAVYQNNANVSNNTITFGGGGLGTVGIQLFGVNSNFTANSNSITAAGQSYNSGGNISAHVGILNNSTGANLVANSNNISITSLAFLGTAGGVSGINSGNGNLTANGNIISNGASPATFYGIITGALTALNVNNNTINGLSSEGASSNVSGIVLNGTALSGQISGNKIYDLSANGATGSAYGVYVLGSVVGTTTNIFNNLIGDLKTPIVSSNNVSLAGIYLASSGATSNLNVYYNTINLNGTSTGANFNSTGVYHANNVVATSASLDLRNNVIVNNSTPNGTGTASAFRRNVAGVNNYAATSNHNDFYGTSWVYWNGTAGNTLADLKTLSRDANSLNLNPSFLATSGSNVDFLKMNPAALITQDLDNKGAPIVGYTLDYAAATRDATTPDMGAYEFTYVAPTTVPDCAVISSPTNFAIGVKPNTALISWSAAARATSYTLTIGTATGLSDVLNVTGLTTLSYNATLSANTQYFVKVVATNSIGDAVGCTEISFTTGALVYCGPLNYSNVEPISNVEFAGINNATSAALGGTAHEFFLSTSGTVKQGQPYEIKLNGNTDGDYTSYYVVFVDWNQNGTLNDAGEVYFADGSILQKNTNGTTSLPVIGNITVPAGAKLGNTRMRIKKEYSGAIPSPSGNFANPCLNGGAFGQAEDYTLNVEVYLAASTTATKSTVSVYPNPFQEVLKISDIKGVKSISVNDISGRLVKNMKPTSELQLSELKTGLYIVTLNMEDGTVKSFKAIKK
jgi:hypothetical protein